MRKRLALLFYRVARWLAPDYFNNRLQSIAEIRARIGVLRERYCSLPARVRLGSEGRFVANELHSLEAVYKSVEAYGKRDDYEILKIEIQLPELLTKGGIQRVMKGEDPVEVLAQEQKRKLFEALAAALSQSVEIENFMYRREYGEVKVLGIRLYLKHDK